MQSYQCFYCDSWNAVDIHHISGRGMGGSKNNAKDFVENLAALCRSCHVKTSNKDFNTKVRIATLRKVLDKYVGENTLAVGISNTFIATSINTRMTVYIYQTTPN